MFAFRELLNARKRGARRDPHARARQGASPTRSARSRAAWRSSSSRAAIGRPHEGRVLRERLDRHRRVHAAAAARRRGHHQPVQLPGDGAAVVLPDRDRRRQRRGAQALREGPERRDLDGRRSCKEAGLPDGVLNVVHGDKEAVDALLEHPDVRVDLVRRLDPDRAVHLRDGHRATASACRRSAARRTTCWCCRMPTSTSPPTPRSTRASARPASAAWRSRSCSRSTPIADELVEKITRAHGARSRTGDGTRGCDMGPLITERAPRQGRRLHRRRGIRRRRRRRRRTRHRGRRRRPTASGSARP